MVMAEMINKVANNAIEDKVEENLLDIANQIDKFAQTINDNNNQQYENFNNNLKKSFGQNLQQI